MNYLTKIRRNPWNLWDELENAILRSFRKNENNDTVLCPQIDTWKDDDNQIIELELPGVAKEDINISVIGNELTVSGKSKHKKEEKEATYQRQYNEFSRTVTLPYEPDASKVTATSKDGVLTIIIPEPVKTKPKKIEIKTA